MTWGDADEGRATGVEHATGPYELAVGLVGEAVGDRLRGGRAAGEDLGERLAEVAQPALVRERAGRAPDKGRVERERAVDVGRGRHREPPGGVPGERRY
ncbi:hypothetical protein ACFSTC_49060 [Nonomuraea ferruginea]